MDAAEANGMKAFTLSFAVILGVVASACGGAVADTVPNDDGSDPGATRSSPSTPAETPDEPSTARGTQASGDERGLVGIYRLAALDGPVGVRVDDPPPRMDVEIQADGTAYKWICSTEITPCPENQRMKCMVGSLREDGARLLLHFPALASQFVVPGMGEVTPAGDGSMSVAYIYPTYSAGLLTRVTDQTSGGCAP